MSRSDATYAAERALKNRQRVRLIGPLKNDRRERGGIICQSRS